MLPNRGLSTIIESTHKIKIFYLFFYIENNKITIKKNLIKTRLQPYLMKYVSVPLKKILHLLSKMVAIEKKGSVNT